MFVPVDRTSAKHRQHIRQTHAVIAERTKSVDPSAPKVVVKARMIIERTTLIAHLHTLCSKISVHSLAADSWHHHPYKNVKQKRKKE